MPAAARSSRRRGAAADLWKIEGYTNEEIAAKLGCVPRTVQSKLQLIRDTWTEEVAP
jgi:DNA-directed RNA polymerase specialized sigma24 family protein